MDTTKTYIKMCEKAKKIQELRPKPDDNDEDDATYTSFFYMPISKSVAILKWDNDTGSAIIGDYAWCDLGDHDGDVWLPRQDQLQKLLIGVGIIAGDWRDVLAKFVDQMWEYEDEHRVGYWNIFTSMEQLWLALVMSQRYQKKWDSEKEDWINE